MRTREMPRVLSPGICTTFAGVTFEPSWFAVSPGLPRPAKKKSSSVTSPGFLHTKPFTKTARTVCDAEVLELAVVGGQYCSGDGEGEEGKNKGKRSH
ncbi:hypothetical protein AXF42_Ash005074 [Apostasia shenzhenica]|uniref:Uncharacterized protein n=1 Tax=Apostasia shenzhenica TaxID=1088818 RepID=A0A2I0B8D1_9ASPA|nr:hypothetical protein AXF42_Ash005074 [Apostasia shenzhenica]